jgi:5-methylcytosine-specific restriction enzyme subunit McrC
MRPPAHVRLKEWETLSPGEEGGEALRGRELSADMAPLVGQLREAGALEVVELKTGLRIAAKAWAGRIRLGDLLVTVEPKLAPEYLLPLLRYAYGLNDLRIFDPGEFSEGGQLLQDLVVAQLAAEARTLIGRGLARSYVARVENLPVPRGRIDFQALVSRLPLLDASLPCRHHTRSSDHLLNQVLLAALRLGHDIAQSPVLRQEVRRLARQLADEVTDIALDERVLRRAAAGLNRLTASYRPALELIRLLHSCSSMSLDDEVTLRLPGFLFDMNRFFQALVGRLFREHLPPGALVEEHALSGMMLYVPGANPLNRRAPTPRPDFMVRDGRRKLLLDAKYRDLWKHELPREMLYQLAIYALSQPEGATATIIYPTATSSAVDAVVEIRDPLGRSGRARVALRPLALNTFVAALEGPRAQQARTDLARRLIIGGPLHGLPPHGRASVSL